VASSEDGGAPPPPKPKQTGPLRVGATFRQRESSTVSSRLSAAGAQTRISGTVRLHAIIGKDGMIQQLEV